MEHSPVVYRVKSKNIWPILKRHSLKTKANQKKSVNTIFLNLNIRIKHT